MVQEILSFLLFSHKQWHEYFFQLEGTVILILYKQVFYHNITKRNVTEAQNHSPAQLNTTYHKMSKQHKKNKHIKKSQVLVSLKSGTTSTKGGTTTHIPTRFDWVKKIIMNQTIPFFGLID